MNETTEADRPRPRPEPRVATPLIHFDLEREVAALRAEPGWHANGHNAKTLVKRSDSRVVLTLLRAGQRLKDHAVDSSASIHVLEGSVTVHAGSTTVDLDAHGFLAMEAGMPHDVEARTDAVILVSL